jgi:hypothetical protein
LIGVREPALPFLVSLVIFADSLRTEMESCLIFKTHGNLPGDGEADSPGELTQLVLSAPTDKFAIRTRRGGGRNLVAGSHVSTLQRPRALHQPFIGKQFTKIAKINQ